MSESADRTARRAIVHGRVQGVGFRYFARERALALGLAGWVRNLPDGRVETRFEGCGEDVERFAEWLRTGPPSAHVKSVEVRPAEVEGRKGFEVAR